MKSSRRRTRQIVALVIPTLVPLSLARAQSGATPTPATLPAADAPADRQRIVEAIAGLGSEDFETRERAARLLWSLGDRALPALRAAVEGDDPEMAQRAQVVLDSFAFGIRPDTPKQVTDLLNRYRAGNEDQKREAAVELAGQGLAGGRVLLKLVREERNETLRRAALQAMAQNSRETAAGLLAGGDVPQATELLRLTAAESEACARDWAAFLLLHGGIDDEVRRLEAQVLPGGNAGAPAPAAPAANAPAAEDVAAPAAVRLAYLYRAKGDLKGARQAAAKADDPYLLDGILADAGDWKALAAAAAARGAGGSIEEMGPVMAYNRLAGDAAAADRWAAKLVEASLGTERHWDAAEVLLLNGRPDQALDVLMRNQDYARASEFLAPRLRIGEAKALLEQAEKEGARDLPAIRIQVAQALAFTGDDAAVTALLGGVAGGAGGRARRETDFFTRLELVSVARTTRQPQALIDAWIIEAIAAARMPRLEAQQVDAGYQPRLERLFAKAGFERPEQAAQWWPALRDIHGGDAPPDTMAKLRALDRKEWSAGDLAKLAADMRAMAANLPPAERNARLQLVADTLSAHGRTDEAIKAYEAAADQAEDAAALTKLADLYADAKRWDDAAAAYARAGAKQPGDAVATAMRGASLVRAGKEAEGRELLTLARLLPLGDEAARDALADALDKRGMKAEALAERELIVRVGEPGGLKTADAIRGLAQAATAKGDHLAAAELWERAFLANLSPEIAFMEVSSNLMIPVMVHRTRAIGLINAGRFEEAIREADRCFEICAGDTDSQIDIIRALDEKGRRAEADALYGRAIGFYEKLRVQYPNSGSALNLVAWLQGSVQRDLDPALAHAKRAAEIEPTNTAILDTLSEVHFARKEYDQALALNASIRKMEPNVEHHRKNLERFTAAKEGRPTTRPASAE